MIYFLRNANKSAIKIGETDRLADLLKHYMSFQGYLEVMGVIGGADGKKEAIHSRFAKHQIIGEWYQPRDEIVSFIAEEASPWNGEDYPSAGRESRSLYLELSETAHRLLRLVAADMEVGLNACVRASLSRQLKVEANRRGIKLVRKPLHQSNPA